MVTYSLQFKDSKHLINYKETAVPSLTFTSPLRDIQYVYESAEASFL